MAEAADTSGAEYRHLVQAVRDAVHASVPDAATVLVVSRGDEELLRFGDLTAWHFPREPDGRYSGYHPRDSADALAHLYRWQDRGAGFLVVPAPSFWWLDYYADFARQLRRHHHMALEDSNCLVIRLDDQIATAASLEAAEPVIPHVAQLVEALLPSDASVAVVSTEDERLLYLGGRKAVHFPVESSPATAPAAIGALERLRTQGIGYLVVPDTAPSWADRVPGFVQVATARYRCLARRQNACHVFDLNHPPRGDGAASDGR